MSVASDIAVEPLWSRVRHWTAPLHGPVLVGLIYYLGAQAAFYIGTLSDQIFALFWPPNVVLFCALLIAPPRQWWLYIAVAFPAHTIAELGVVNRSASGFAAIAAVTTAAITSSRLTNSTWVRRSRRRTL